MCLIIFAHQADPRFPLILAANRDEFFSRPTEQADFWAKSESSRSLLAGRDLVAGGTWLGITRTGRFAAVTNIRDPSQAEQKPRSRGELTLEFLTGEQSPQQYCDALIGNFKEFAGYNLLLSDGQTMCYVNNLEEQVWQLKPGVYGLSNGLLNSAWPKVERGRQQMQALLQADEPPTTDRLIAMMRNTSKADDKDLPNTGIGIDLERQLSSAFISNTERQYGTRCSSAIISEHGGQTRFSEQNYDEFGEPGEHRFFVFQDNIPST
jgi:uncharacterized protein with NRDE domain